VSVVIITVMVTLLLCCTVTYIGTSECRFYFYNFPNCHLPCAVLLHILHIYPQTLKRINCIISYNMVQYLYIPHLLLHIVYIQPYILRYINFIINSNNAPYSYFPHVLFLHILYIQLQTLKCINSIIICNMLLIALYINLQIKIH
jgi:hypothetical protein